MRTIIWRMLVYNRDKGEKCIMKYLHIRLQEILQEKGISRARVCKDLDLQRTNLNRYYRDQFQRIDANLIVKLCDYLDCEVGDLFEIRDDEVE